MRRRWGWIACAVIASLLLAGCSAGKLAKKAVWFTVGTTGKLALKTVETTGEVAMGAGKLAVEGVGEVVDFTANAATKLMANRKAREAVTKFWLRTQGAEYLNAYLLFSKGLRGLISQGEFTGDAAQWAGRIRTFEVLDGLVRKHHVEVPVDLNVEAEGKNLRVPVRVRVIEEEGEWKIDGWEVKRPRLKR